jgi:ethanolamine utilization protein EutQ
LGDSASALAAILGRYPRRYGAAMNAMNAMNVTRFSSSDATAWFQCTDRPIFLADVLDEHSPSAMTVGFARYGAGAANEWTVTYDEALVITRGTFTVRHPGGATTAHAGEVLFLPRGTPLTYLAETDVELVYVTYPHWAAATRRSEHAAQLDAFHPVPPP